MISIISFINVHQFISTAAEANLLRMLQRVQPVLPLYTALQGFAALCRKAQVNGRLVNGYGIRGRQNADVMYIRFRRVPVRVSKQETEIPLFPAFP